MKRVEIERDKSIRDLEQDLFKTISDIMPKEKVEEVIPLIPEVSFEQALKELIEMENNLTSQENKLP